MVHARGSLIGFFVGVLPGAGATVAAFLTYSAEKKYLKIQKTSARENLKD